MIPGESLEDAHLLVASSHGIPEGQRLQGSLTFGPGKGGTLGALAGQGSVSPTRAPGMATHQLLPHSIMVPG